MLIAAESKKEITTFKAQLSGEFEMKDLGVALGMKITRDRNSGLLLLVGTITLSKFFIILLCLIRSLSLHLLHHISNFPSLNHSVKILSIWHEFHILVILVL
jgi:hypothetical protein